MQHYPEEDFFGFNRTDGTISFYNFVNSLCRPDSIVVDFGAGRGGFYHDDPCHYRKDRHTLKGRVAKVFGIDVDSAVFENNAVDEARLLRNGKIPLSDNSVDLILADWVFEHLPDPASTVMEFCRVLKPGGYICARTPNKFGYIALGSQIIPSLLHSRVLRHLQPLRNEEDVFPKFYRLNSPKELRTNFDVAENIFELVTFCIDSSPGYGTRGSWTYAGFRALHAITPECLKSVRFVFARKLK